MSATLVASVQTHGSKLDVVADESGAVALPSRTLTSRGHVLSPDAARELLGLLEAALRPGAPVGRLGVVTAAGEIPLYVTRSPADVRIGEHEWAGASWNLRLRDQVEALRDALRQAVGVGV